MNIVKYGAGYEPKVATCKNCKSEIEYLDEDLSETQQALFCGEENVGVIKDIGFNCPVCNEWITIERNKFMKIFF